MVETASSSRGEVRRDDGGDGSVSDGGSDDGVDKDHTQPHPHRRDDHDDHAAPLHHLFDLYSPPRQRQRWGDRQMHPHKNWGDIFFDLFYVAAAYNLGNLLRIDPSPRGLLYLVRLLVQQMRYCV